MKKIETDVVIIGGGLAGLCTAYLLRDKDISVSIVEARSRIGGRIHTKYQDGQAPIELGATWLGKKHERLQQLLVELDIDTFEQVLGETAVYEPMSINPPQIVRLPPNEDPSYRIQDGTSQLIKKLVDHIDDDRIYLNQAAKSIDQKNDLVTITNDYEFTSKMVLSTLPPYLFNQTIQVMPSLPEDLVSIARKTHTWMGESIKVALTYDRPFWREGNLSGTIFSNVGPIPEMYDHSNYEDNQYALKGFFNSSYHAISREERLSMVLTQLKKYYGTAVEDYITYEETVWASEKYTFAPYTDYVLPHQHGGHDVYQKGYLSNQLYLGGAETAVHHPGYMDGAVSSAIFLSNQVRAFFK